MSVGTATPPRPIVVTPPQPGQHVVIDDIDWEAYVTIADAIPDGSSIRTAYDGRSLQLMTVSPEHEYFKTVLRTLIESLALEMGGDKKGGGSLTLRSRLVERGIEPDECFWFANASKVLKMKRWDPQEYPPPDLVLEVDVTSASIARQPIYEKLQVPELWRYDGRSLTALHLNQDGEYVAHRRSLTFPFLTVNDLLPFIEVADDLTDNELIARFLDWVREQNFDVDATPS